MVMLIMLEWQMPSVSEQFDQDSFQEWVNKEVKA